MSFVIVAVVMLAVAAGCVAVPLWRARSRPRPSSEDANRAIHAARAEELDQDLASGRLAQNDYAAARRDLDLELTDALLISRQEQERSAQAHGKHWIAGMAAALLVVVAAVLYWQLGNWRAGVEGVRQASVASVEQMVTQLAQRLRTTDQNDLQGWEMLAHAYLLMGRYQDAADAYARARSLSGDGNSEVLAGYGEALALADPNEFMSKAMPAFEKALQLDPRNPQALWYGGLGALERGDKNVAIARWNALLAQHPPAEYQSIIEKAITAAGGTVNPSNGIAADPAAATLAGGIQIEVTLASRLRGKVKPDETLYVFAEPVGQTTGPPLAVRRFQVSDLPLHVRLTDNDSMTSGRKLSSFKEVNLIARISRSGAPQQRSGDLVGTAIWHVGDKTTANVRIDDVTP